MNAMHRRHHKISCALAFVALFASSVLVPLAPAFAGSPSDDLKQIEYKYYFRGKYQQAIESLQTFLARVDVNPADALRAREMLAASYVLGGAPAMGKQMFAEMIAKNPSYPGPDPNVFKLEVMDEYAKARTEYAAMALMAAPAGDDDDEGGALVPTEAAVAAASVPIYKKWWFYAGAAALVAGVAVAVGGGGGGDTPPPADNGGVVVGVTVH
jgi:hypothetical protein